MGPVEKRICRCGPFDNEIHVPSVHKPQHAQTKPQQPVCPPSLLPTPTIRPVFPPQNEGACCFPAPQPFQLDAPLTWCFVLLNF